MSVYISTGGFRNLTAFEAIKTLENFGIKDIELSGEHLTKIY